MCVFVTCPRLPLALPFTPRPGSPAAVPEEFHLRSVARESVTLAGCSAGLAHFYGCTFSDEQFGLCAAGLFSQLAGFAPREALDG